MAALKQLKLNVSSGQFEDVASKISLEYEHSQPTYDQLASVLPEVPEGAFVIQLAIYTRDTADMFELGEVAGGIKTMLSIVAEEAKDIWAGHKLDLKTVSKELGAEERHLVITFAVHASSEADAIAMAREYIDMLHPFNFTAEVELSQAVDGNTTFKEDKIPAEENKMDIDSYLEGKDFLKLRASLEVSADRTALNNAIDTWKVQFDEEVFKTFLSLIRLSNNLDLTLDVADLAEFVKHSPIPYPGDLPLVHDFASLRHYASMFASKEIKDLPEEAVTMIKPVYDGLLRTCKGLASVKVGFCNNILNFDFEGIDLFDFLPPFEDLQKEVDVENLASMELLVKDSNFGSSSFGMTEKRVLMLGIDASGKTCLMYKLKLGEVVTTIPTIGFNVESIEYKKVNYTFWDVGGQEKIRTLWRHYYQGTHAVVYVVDSNDPTRFGETKDMLHQLLKEEELKDAALLVYANKQDLPNAATVSELSEKLELNSLRTRNWYIQASCATTGDGLYEGLDWLNNTLAK
eukprot:TRINITY_DN9635_c0_g1_i1.p1 TRINITY_DN9635_c0_g1~~TRINITY_DN9635_c0_g1_i1.p1  ORF type:complete len:517 (-),score=131.51 TRINITY_DN9635_c0_g1_i1:42-1592(-)